MKYVINNTSPYQTLLYLQGSYEFYMYMIFCNLGVSDSQLYTFHEVF